MLQRLHIRPAKFCRGYALNTYCAILVFLIICLHFILQPVLLAQQKVEREYLLKAAFVYNFTKYIEWQDPDRLDSFVITVLGKSDILVPLNEIAKRNSVDGKTIRINHIATINDFKDCHILFIAPSEAENLDHILDIVEYENILTVADSHGFAMRGVAINFVIIEGRIKFKINSQALKRAELNVGSQLLKVGLMVKDERQRES